mgnify:CR=1 FL=1
MRCICCTSSFFELKRNLAMTHPVSAQANNNTTYREFYQILLGIACQQIIWTKLTIFEPFFADYKDTLNGLLPTDPDKTPLINAGDLLPPELCTTMCGCRNPLYTIPRGWCGASNAATSWLSQLQCKYYPPKLFTSLGLALGLIINTIKCYLVFPRL